jgi:nucleoside-diphosphate-sugar epimerase
MKKLVLGGGSGFLGQVLADHFRKQNWSVANLTRNPKQPHDIHWDASSVGSWKSEFESAEAVINLTGKSVNCRYTAKNRAEIMDSRVNSTRAIGEASNASIRPGFGLTRRRPRFTNTRSARRMMRMAKSPPTPTPTTLFPSKSPKPGNIF